MIRELGVDPGSILTVTFSRAGARDLQERCLDVYGDDRPPAFSTIHSFALSVIRYCERRMHMEASGSLRTAQDFRARCTGK